MHKPIDRNRGPKQYTTMVGQYPDNISNTGRDSQKPVAIELWDNIDLDSLIYTYIGPFNVPSEDLGCALQALVHADTTIFSSPTLQSNSIPYGKDTYHIVTSDGTVIDTQKPARVIAELLAKRILKELVNKETI